MASVTRSTLPVAMAGGIRTVVDWKFALMEHPRPHGVAQKQAARERMDSLSTRWASGLFGCTSPGSVSWSWTSESTAMWEGITGMPSSAQARCSKSSWARGAGGARRTPGDELGVFSSPSLDPYTPTSLSVLS